jgi:hypothetical protein
VVIVPAPDASVFYHKPEYASATTRPPAFGQSIGFRRTTIPILLTAGLIVIGLGVMHFASSSENNPMGGLPIWLTALLFLLGLILWGLAVANMMTVKHLMQAQEEMG